jgi:hypothetical protein
MGFFEDTKPPELAEPAAQVVKQGALAVLIAGLITLVIMLIAGAGKVLWAILKPYIEWCTNIEGKSRQEAFGRLACLVVPFLLGALLIYRIPFVRDFISLKDVHTINHSNGYRISFPANRSLFVTRDARHIVHNDGTRIYIAYAGYTEKSMQKMGANQCQLVPRSERMGFSSYQPPLQAEGFEDEVVYPISVSVSDMHGWRYASYLSVHPSYWFKTRAELSAVMVQYETTSSWEEFVNNWNQIWSPPNMDGRRPFEVRALPREHAVACF